jgi:uracil-DNA glycosylase
MKMRREDVYILNILRCRPPGNRNPLPVEAAACREFLDGQLAVIQPDFICCLGAVAAQNLLQTDTPIGRLRGRVLDYNGIKVVCTYHPAYVLRNPPAKQFVWDDIKLLMAEMGKA